MRSGAIPKLIDAAICNTMVKFPLLPSRFFQINHCYNLDFSFVNLSHVLKGLYASYFYEQFLTLANKE